MNTYRSTVLRCHFAPYTKSYDSRWTFHWWISDSEWKWREDLIKSDHCLRSRKSVSFFIPSSNESCAKINVSRLEEKKQATHNKTGAKNACNDHLNEIPHFVGRSTRSFGTSKSAFGTMFFSLSLSFTSATNSKLQLVRWSSLYVTWFSESALFCHSIKWCSI